MQSDLFNETIRIDEEISNHEYIPRIRELEAAGAKYFRITVLKHNLGYRVECVAPAAALALSSSSSRNLRG